MRSPTRYIATALLCAAVLTLAACGGSGREKKQINPPRASIQQLTVQPNGQWRLIVRLQNFSNRPADFSSTTASLKFGGQDAGSFTVAAGMSIGPQSADTVETTITPALGGKLAVASALAASQSVRYEIRGQIGTSQRDAPYEFSYESSLNPAPGLPGVLR
ncbi:MAG: hypothetical protein ABI588_09480 [Arenimonas sp.]